MKLNPDIHIVAFGHVLKIGFEHHDDARMCDVGLRVSGWDSPYRVR